MVLFVLLLRAVDPQLEEATGMLEQAREKWADANKLAVSLQTQAASDAFEEALTLYARGLPALTDYSEYARCLIDFAAVSVDANQKTQGEKLFTQALVFGTKAAPSETVHSPRARKVYDEAKKKLSRAGRATMSVVGRPEGATVLLDGRPVGEVPVSVPDIIEGEHFITVTKDRFSRFFGKIRITPGKLERVEVFLTERVKEAAPAPAVVEPAPATAPTVIQTSDAVSAVTKPRVHPFVALLPFGAAQFAEGRPGAGVAFLISEVALLAGNILSFVFLKNMRRTDGTVRPEDVSAATALTVTTNVCFGLLIAEVIGGAIEGELRR